MSKKPIDRESLPYRPCVGVMLLNDRGQVFVARRCDSKDAWQMPQGGIDEGEGVHEAALRELKEEIGTDKAEILGETAEKLRYDLPARSVIAVYGTGERNDHHHERRE